jgi:N-formylglutamate amidohydrolase
VLHHLNQFQSIDDAFDQLAKRGKLKVQTTLQGIKMVPANKPLSPVDVEHSLPDSDYTQIANGRFKGGYNNREFGDPRNEIHTIQIEMCQSTYMNEISPFNYHPDLADRVKFVEYGMVTATFEAMVQLGK